MKTLGFVLLAALAVGCSSSSEGEKDPPEVAARKAECKKLQRHIFEISPQSGVEGLSGAARDQKLDQLVAKVPIEDLEQCAAAEPEAVACMQAAPDVAGVRACIPFAVECQGPTTTVAEGHPIYKLAGECKAVRVTASRAVVIGGAVGSLEVAGNDDIVRIGATPSIAITGNGNRVTWKPAQPNAQPPAVSDKGTGNTVAQAK